MTRPSIVRTSLLLLALQVVFRLGDAVLPLLLAAWFGRSHATDVYYFSWAAFAFAGSVVFSAFQDSAVVPILAEVKLLSPALWSRVTGSLLAHTLVIGSLLSACIGIVALGVFAARYDTEELALAARMVPLFCLFLVALSVKTFAVAVLNSAHRFVAHPVAGAAGIITTLVVIALLRDRAGVLAIPAAALAGELTAIGVLGYVAFYGMNMRITLTLERPEPVRRFARLALSEVTGGALTRINPIVDQLMASWVGIVGAGTLLRYSSDVATIPTSLLQASLLPVLLSVLSDDFGAGNLAKARATVNRTLVSVCSILAAASLALYLASAPILRFAFLRGQMDAAGVERMIELMPYHLVGVAPFGALLVLARAHVALKNSRIMVSMGLINACSNVLFDVVLLRPLGLKGVALSTSLVHTVVAIVFYVRLESRLAREGLAVGVTA